MRKKVRKFTNAVVVLSMAVCFAGCGNSEATNNSGRSVAAADNSESHAEDEDNSVSSAEESIIQDSSAEKEKIKIDDIAWNVEEGIVDGDRYVLLDYTNNTPYTITYFEITFKERADVTEEEKTAFYSDIQNKLEASDEDMEELKGRQITMHTETERVVDPGEAVSNINCYYYSGSFYLKDIVHYNLVEPDIATIKYIDGDKIFTVYYDFTSKKYSAESETETAYQWSDTELSNKVPKPDVNVLESDGDDESIFMFDAYGLSLEEFNAYVEECKNLGYTIDQGSYDGFYSADNAEGYNVYLYYDEDDYSMSGTVSAPDTENE